MKWCPLSQPDLFLYNGNIEINTSYTISCKLVVNVVLNFIFVHSSDAKLFEIFIDDRFCDCR